MLPIHTIAQIGTITGGGGGGGDGPKSECKYIYRLTPHPHPHNLQRIASRKAVAQTYYIPYLPLPLIPRIHPLSHSHSRVLAFIYSFSCTHKHTHTQETQTDKQKLHLCLTLLVWRDKSFSLRLYSSPQLIPHPSSHSNSRSSTLVFIHSPCPSPLGRPAPRSAAAGSDPCLSHLQLWRLSCHPIHT